MADEPKDKPKAKPAETPRESVDVPAMGVGDQFLAAYTKQQAEMSKSFNAFNVFNNSMKLSDMFLTGGYMNAYRNGLLATTFPYAHGNRVSELEKDQFKLREEINRLMSEINQKQQTEKEKSAALAALQKKITEYEQKEQFRNVIDCVRPEARELLFSKEEFKKHFSDGQEWDAFVLSVDIRRSTELMLKARSPQDFASFISELCTLLRAVVLDNYGVFDKFTGDGILASFPIFYSGKDAIYHSLRAAKQCHEVFADVYLRNRNRFNSVLKNVGLGIGIDYGRVGLLKIGGGLTVVGTPVVYACRLGGAPAGKTVLNQPAFEQAKNILQACFRYDEVTIEVKNEGAFIAYEASIISDFKAAMPEWLSEIGKPQK